MPDDVIPGWPWAQTEAEACDAEDDGELGGSPTPCDLTAGHDGPHAAVYFWGP